MSGFLKLVNGPPEALRLLDVFSGVCVFLILHCFCIFTFSLMDVFEAIVAHLCIWLCCVYLQGSSKNAARVLSN